MNDGLSSPTPLPVLGFLGTGLMAAPMIRRLLSAGYTVHVWNRTAAKAQPLIDAGAIAVATPRSLAHGADIVLMCVMDADAVAATIFGGGGLGEGAGAIGGVGGASMGPPLRAKILVDHSSIKPEATRRFAQQLKSATGIDWIDAPVSGGVAGAVAGSLAIMCGGDPSAIETVTPVLRAYSGKVTRMGDVGAGQTTKLINQILVCSVLTTLAESVTLALAAGIDAARLPEALAGGFADSKPLQVFAPRMVNGYQDAIGTLATLLKDIDTAVELARSLNCALPMAASAQQLLRLMSARGLAEADPSDLIQLFRDNPVVRQPTAATIR